MSTLARHGHRLARTAARSPLTRELLRLSLRATPLSTLRLGSEYGGWWVPSEVLSHAGLAYCAGVGTDISFDLALVEHGYEVWAFDPTPVSLDWVGEQDVPESWHFESVGLWDEAGEIEFFAPADPAHVSFSATNAQGTDASIRARVDSVPRIMTSLGHDQIDILKLDIEGAEGRVLRNLIHTETLPTVICVEFDAPEAPWRTRRRIVELIHAGYTLTRSEGWNFTLVRSKTA